MNDRMPPVCLEAERAVLGSMLRDNQVISSVVQILHRPEFFYTDAHQKLYRACLDLYGKSEPVDLVTVANYLKEHKQVEDIGGYPYLAELWDASPTAANADSYARIVRGDGISRSLIHSCVEILRDAYDQAMPADELLESAERSIFAVADLGASGQSVPICKAMIEAALEIDARQNPAVVGSGLVSTGFDDLDNLTGGLHGSELILLAARPSTGKTALAISILRHAVMEQGIPVFFASLEQSRIEIAERLMCQHGEVDSFRLRRPGLLRPEDIERLADAKTALSAAALFIDDSPCQSVLRISANARRHRLKHKIGLVVVDYIQLIDPENKKDNRNEQVSQISRRLKWLARELKIPVLALAQLNRASEQRANDRPRLSDLRDSGSLEQDGDTIFLLHEPGDQDQGRIDVIVAKQRNGPKDETSLRFNKRFVKFEPFVPEYQEA